ncbi:MAG TPA: cytochrome c [Rhizobiaceae bacterium]|nr:cytochrome c [Rhizobiaceae bacterium]
MKKLFFSVAAATLLFAGAAHADAIADRKAEMKNNGASMKLLAQSAKGEVAYDAAAVLNALTSMRTTTTNFADLFPAGTETGGETTASPKIWEDMAGFKAALAKFHTDLDAAIAAAPADPAALGPVLASVGGNCQSCHESFRIMKN